MLPTTAPTDQRAGAGAPAADRPADRPLALRIVAVLVGLLVAATAAVTFAAPAGAGTAEDEARLFQLTNTSRSQYGRAPLAYDAAASNVARAWAQELARSRSLRHNPNLSSQVSSQVTNQWTLLGENVGYSDAGVDSVHNAYMNSTGHRNNILGNFNRVGVGTARDSTGRLWSTVIFMQGPALPTVSVASFSPFPSAAALVSQQYLDFLGRQPDAGGLQAWTTALQTGQTRPVDMIAGFVNSPEYGHLVEPIVRLYAAYFGRLPDLNGLLGWLQQRRLGVSLDAVSNAFAQSLEFRSRYGSLSDNAFVELLYRNVLGRVADLNGLLAWVGQLVAGVLDRGAVMLGFSESAEFRRATNARVKVTAVYFGMLRRSPDPTGLAAWSQLVQAGRPLSELVLGVFGSPEYRNRF